MISIIGLLSAALIVCLIIIGKLIKCKNQPEEPFENKEFDHERNQLLLIAKKGMDANVCNEIQRLEKAIRDFIDLPERELLHKMKLRERNKFVNVINQFIENYCEEEINRKIRIDEIERLKNEEKRFELRILKRINEIKVEETGIDSYGFSVKDIEEEGNV